VIASRVSSYAERSDHATEEADLNTEFTETTEKKRERTAREARRVGHGGKMASRAV
jgi:hypothetical protein